MYNSEAYSDGYIDYNPPVSFNPHVIFCRHCKKPIWYEDIDFIDFGTYDEIERNGAVKSCDIFDLPMTRESNYNYNIAAYYSGLIDEGFVDTDGKEIKLRFEIWHLLNNFNRFRTAVWFTHFIHARFRIAFKMLKEWKQRRNEVHDSDKLFRKNLKRLCEIYQPANEEEKLLQAEMFREMRNFNTANKLMLEINDLNSTNAYRKINRAIKLRKSRVIKLN